MSYLDQLMEALKMKQTPVAPSVPTISGTPGPELPLPEIEPASGAPLLNNGILAQIAKRKAEQDAMRAPATEAPVEQMKAAQPNSIPARPMPTATNASVPVAPDVAAKPQLPPESPYGQEL